MSENLTTNLGSVGGCACGEGPLTVEHLKTCRLGNRPSNDQATNLSRVEQIRRAHAHARPKDANPAWFHCHNDCGVLLEVIEHVWQLAQHGIPNYAYGDNEAASELAGRLRRIEAITGGGT